MKTTCLSVSEIQQVKRFFFYDFKIPYCLETQNVADRLSLHLTDKDAENELVELNQKILYKLQQYLSKNNFFLLIANCEAVAQKTMFYKENYTLRYCKKILKILIAGIIASPNVKKL